MGMTSMIRVVLARLLRQDIRVSGSWQPHLQPLLQLKVLCSVKRTGRRGWAGCLKSRAH